MKRLQFIKGLVTGVTALVASKLPAAPAAPARESYSFNEVFNVHPGNENLIYPKKDSELYTWISNSFADNLNLEGHLTYLPVHHLSIPVKDIYTKSDLLPVKFYFESVYGANQEYITQDNVAFRFIKDQPDRMHLEVFLNYRYSR